MPKKKKTRKQKLQTDERRYKEQIISSDHLDSQPSDTKKQSLAQTTTFSLPTHYSSSNQKITPQDVTITTSASITTKNYEYLQKDLFKTAFLTSAIVVAELLVRFFLERG